MQNRQMPDLIPQLMDGTLGHFWTELADVHNLRHSIDGFVRATEDSLFQIETLRTAEYLKEFGTDEGPMPRPIVMYGLTGVAPAMFFDLAGISRNNVIGEGPSTQTVRMRGVVCPAPLGDMADRRFVSAQVTVPQITRWSGLVGAVEKPERSDNGRFTGYQIQTRTPKPLEIELRPSQKIVLSTTWSVKGPPDKREFSTPLQVGSVSTKPLRWGDHLQPITAVQDLINLAYQGFVKAEGGHVQFAEHDGNEMRQRPDMWNSRFMTVPPGIKPPKSLTEFPMFYLKDIGGVKGLRNWIRLDKKYPRATGPLANKYRYGTHGAEVRLIEVATGIEYWTAVHRRSAKWAQPAYKNEPLPAALARYVGPSFTQFVGDVDVWSKKFWDTYNGLKHAPNFEYDVSEVATLGDSGALLLLGALLNRVANNKKVMAAICDSHRNYGLGLQTRKVVRG